MASSGSSDAPMQLDMSHFKAQLGVDDQPLQARLEVLKGRYHARHRYASWFGDDEVQQLLDQLDKWLTTSRDDTREPRPYLFCLALLLLITCVCVAACRSLVVTARAMLAKVPIAKEEVNKDFLVVEVHRMVKQALEKPDTATSGIQLQLLTGGIISHS